MFFIFFLFFLSPVCNNLSQVHRMMSCQGRYYHRTEHVFDLFTTGREQPHAAFAAIFHDTVSSSSFHVS